jgi:hypothetical protein
VIEYPTGLIPLFLICFAVCMHVLSLAELRRSQVVGAAHRVLTQSYPTEFSAHLPYLSVHNEPIEESIDFDLSYLSASKRSDLNASVGPEQPSSCIAFGPRL